MTAKLQMIKDEDEPMIYFKSDYSQGAHPEGWARYERVTNEEALSAFRTLCRREGILPALESSHALA